MKMNQTTLILSILSILLWFGGFIFQGKALVVSRGWLDVFNNPNVTTCVNNERYCKDRRAVCFAADCCKCRCEVEYSTFHSPGLVYELRNAKPSYTFGRQETCVWNHYAHEGCRFIEETPSLSSRRFIPLINLNENGTLHLKVLLNGVYQCNQYRLFVKTPKELDWVSLVNDADIFKTVWKESTDNFLTLQWQKQGPKYGGLMLKLNFTCDSAVKGRREPCIILKIKGTYDTQTNISILQIPTEEPTTATTRSSEAHTKTSSPPTTKSTRTTNLPSHATKILPVVTKPAVKAVVVPGKKSKPKKKMESINKTKPVGDAGKANDSHEDRGETFWVLVYVFMSFAIFEVICVALFFICRHRRKRKQKENATNETTSNYDNHGMPEARTSTIDPQSYPENIELYENEEPRYSSIKQIRGSLKRSNDGIALIENGIPATMAVPEQRSRQNSHISQARSIIVLPKDCVIVHASGSRKSRQSRHSTRADENTHDIGLHNHAGPTSDDNRSLYSWESVSSCYRTSTDEDYVSGSNRVAWEEDSLYEEPDKVIQKCQSPVKSFGLERLFALQESVIKNAHYANEDSDKPTAGNEVENCGDDKEHIYETAEGAIARDRSLSYYENAYDLPEDALAKCLGKPNRYALKHVLHVDNTEDDEDTPSLNLGMEFVNNNEETEEGEDVKLRPTKRSTLYLHKGGDESDNGASVC